MHEDIKQEGHKYPGSKGDYTEKLSFLLPTEYHGIPVYRVLDHDGQVIDPAHDPNIDDAELVRNQYTKIFSLQALGALYELRHTVRIGRGVASMLRQGTRVGGVGGKSENGKNCVT